MVVAEGTYTTQSESEGENHDHWGVARIITVAQYLSGALGPLQWYGGKRPDCVADSGLSLPFPSPCYN